MIYHLTSRDAWRLARETGSYRAPSLDGQGFIHMSATPEQVQRVANGIFAGADDLVVLVIDPTALSATLRYEPPDTTVPAEHSDGEQFPHLYGPLETSAVVRVLDYPSRADGTFALLSIE
jgi:uncharacterized protein (DUF952 family)